MKNVTRIGLMVAVIASFPVPAMAGDEAAASARDHVAGLASMCAENAAAVADRQAAKSLYDRLGGYDKILVLTKEIVRLHQVNEDFRLMMTYVDGDQLARHVADFISAGTGGTAEYTGRDMVAAHKHMQMTNGDFLSAGGDVMKAMQNLGYGQNEIDEVVCILVSMKDMVIYE